MTSVFKLDNQILPAGYDLIRNDRPNHHSLAPPVGPTICGPKVEFSALAGRQFVCPAEMQGLQWTFAGFKLLAMAEPTRLEEGGDDDCYLLACILYECGPSLGTAVRTDRALTLAAQAEKSGYPVLGTLQLPLVKEVLELLDRIVCSPQMAGDASTLISKLETIEKESIAADAADAAT